MQLWITHAKVLLLGMTGCVALMIQPTIIYANWKKHTARIKKQTFIFTTRELASGTLVSFYVHIYPTFILLHLYVSMTFYFINTLFIHLYYSGRCRDREVVCRYVPFMDPDCKSEHAQRNCPKYCGTCWCMLFGSNFYILLQLQYRYKYMLQMSLHVYKFQTKYSNIL